MAEIDGARLKYLRNGIDMWQMTSRFGKWLRYTGFGLSVGETV